jgi:GMP synthase-like glutamine amidotransferase
MKIGILETGRPPRELQEKHGTYADLFARLLDGHGFDFVGYAVVDGVFPESVRSADGWLITGSRHGVYEPHDWIPPLEHFIRESLDEGVPMVGICFGHQIMAQAMGGKVEKFSGGWKVGGTDYTLNGAPMRLIAWHQDQVVEKPDGAVCFAEAGDCRYAALAYGRSGLSLQPHPEFDRAFSRDLLEARGGILPEEVRDRAAGSFDASMAASSAADMIANFFIESRKPA